MNFNLVSVGIADFQVVSSPDILRTILGSCVGICCYDIEERIAGLAHIMLPKRNSESTNDKKYADSAIPMLLKAMEDAGARKECIIAKIAGGAAMFKIGDHRLISEIGRNNINKVREVLSDLNIEIVAEDTGGDYGRTIDFFSEDGKLKVKAVKKRDLIL